MGDEAEYLYGQHIDELVYENTRRETPYKHRSIRFPFDGEEIGLRCDRTLHGAQLECLNLNGYQINQRLAAILLQHGFIPGDNRAQMYRPAGLAELDIPKLLNHIYSERIIEVRVWAQVLQGYGCMRIQFNGEPAAKIKKRMRDFEFRYKKSTKMWEMQSSSFDNIKLNKVLAYLKNQPNLVFVGGTQL